MDAENQNSKFVRRNPNSLSSSIDYDHDRQPQTTTYLFLGKLRVLHFIRSSINSGGAGNCDCSRLYTNYQPSLQKSAPKHSSTIIATTMSDSNTSGEPEAPPIIYNDDASSSSDNFDERSAENSCAERVK